MSPHPRHVLITGASRGIGLAVAQLFAKSSYRCTLIARSEEGLKKAVASLEPLKPSTTSPTSTTSSGSSNDHALQHSYVAGTISTPPSPSTSFWTTEFAPRFPKPPSSDPTHPSRIDVLVNCAGITQSSLFMRTSDDAIDEIINLNLTVLMKGTKFLLRQGYIRGSPQRSPSVHESEDSQNRQPSSPVIVNVSSLLGLQGGFGATAYAASKAGVLGFTRALAAEYSSHRVRVNAVVPGYIATDMTSALNSAELTSRIPLGRFGAAEEVAHAVRFLVENEYAHNCVLNLDGGLSSV